MRKVSEFVRGVCFVVPTLLAPLRTTIYPTVPTNPHSTHRQGERATARERSHGYDTFIYAASYITASDTAPWDPGINYNCPEIARQPVEDTIAESDLPRHWALPLDFTVSYSLIPQHGMLIAPYTVCPSCNPWKAMLGLLSSDGQKASNSQYKSSWPLLWKQWTSIKIPFLLP